MERDNERIVAFDGLRGWAALSVVAFHLTWETFGAVFPVFRTFPFAFVANGGLAVSLFLMVSGYVLTVRGWRAADKRPIARSITKRYLRLTIPILASVLIFWAVIALGLTTSPQAGEVVQRPDWLMAFAYFDPNLLDALWFGLVQVYVHTYSNSYGPFLWTMTIELWGSYVVLVLCLAELPVWWSYVPLLALIAVCLMLPFSPYFPVAACYPAGALVALLVRDGAIANGERGGGESLFATLVIGASLIAAALAEMTIANLQVTALLAMVIFIATLRSRPVFAFLSLPLSLWLGRLSFPLYLMQISVITTLTSLLILVANRASMLSAWTATGIAIVSIAACLAVAQAFMPVERLALRLAERFGKWLVPEGAGPT